MNKRLFVIVLMGFAMVFQAYSLSYNSSYDDITLLTNGWCTNVPITFKIYNKTQYEDKKFENKLCEEDENPKDDNCNEYTNINANLVIYNGPFDSFSELENVKFSDNTYSYTFTKENSYLVQVIVNKGKFNEYEKILDVKSCSANSGKLNSGSGGVQAPDLYNNTFTYSSSQSTITIENSDVDEKSDIAVTLLSKTSDRSLPELSNITKLLEVNYDTSTYSKFSLETSVSANSSDELMVYTFDGLNWTLTSDYTYSEGKVIFDEVTSNYYAFVINEQQISQEPEIEITSPEPEEEEVVVIDGSSHTDEEGFSKISIIAYGIIGVIIIVMLYLLFSHNAKKDMGSIYRDFKKNKEKEDSTTKEKGSETEKKKEIDNEKKEVEKNVVEPGKKEGFFSKIFKKRNKNLEGQQNQANKTHDEAANELYAKTREYVRKYKNSYSKEGIRQALKSVNISDEVIETVFEEEYR